MRFLKTFTAIALLSLTPLIASAQHQGHRHTHASDSEHVLLETLRDGGNVIFFRHERTNMLIQDAPDMVLEDCSSQRNLSVTGIAAAIENGRYIRELDIPIGQVRSSPMCRTMETARYAFDRVESDARLMGTHQQAERGRPAVAEDLRALVDEYIGGEDNAVFVAHFSNVEEGFNTRLYEGDAAVIRLLDGTPSVIGIIRANQWSDLVFAEVRERLAATGETADGDQIHGSHDE